jgi:hypothetical protein
MSADDDKSLSVCFRFLLPAIDYHETEADGALF